MKNQNTHAILLTLVGCYILYIAYQLLDGLLSGKDDMSQTAAIVAIAVFTLGGIAVLIYAWKLWRDAKKSDQNESDHEETMK